MGLIVDIALVEITPANGATVLARLMESIDVGDDDSALETVKTMNAERVAVGYKSGIGDIEFTLNHKIGIPREVDYLALKAGEIEFSCLYQELSGKTTLGDRYNLTTCRVASITRGYNESGDAMDVVRCKALKHEKEL